MGTGGYLVEPFIFTGAEAADGKVKVLGLPHNRRIFPHGFIPAEHVAVCASGRMLRAPMVHIPRDGDRRTRIRLCGE